MVMIYAAGFLKAGQCLKLSAMEPKISKRPATGSYPELTESILRPHTTFETYFKILLPSTSMNYK
jgi:hypothetical protein